MWNPLMSARTLRLAVFVVGTAMLTAVATVPVRAQDKPLSKRELKNLITNATTKADHERIAQYFDAEATKYDAESKEHGELAQLYQRNTSSTPTKYPGSAQSFQHCGSLSKSLHQAAEDARQLAAEHREMANEVRK